MFIMKINISILRFVFLLSVLTGIASAGSMINCNQIFSATYAGNLAKFTDFSGIAEICILIVMLDFSIVSVVYAFGAGFQIQNLTNFAKQELLEGVFNLIILVAVGGAVLAVYGGLSFFLNVAQYGTTTYGTATYVQPGATTHDIYVGLCNGIDSNVIWLGFSNWAYLTVNLFVANTLSFFNVLIIPNSWGYAYQPFGGTSLLITLLWDDQAAYFGTMFFGMFLVVLLFIIYYLFPIFLFTGLALRSFPWTRAAGGSLIAMFIAFYIVFPALMYPFVTGAPGSFICPQPAPPPPPATNPLCLPTSFKTAAVNSFLGLFHNYNFGEQYYTDVTNFAGGFFGIGLDMFGLVIALLISYEMVEKIGSILGAPSMNAQRALSRIL